MPYVKTDLEAAIVGAGVSGIATACRLQMDYGLQHFRIFEKDVTWGGTWQQNQYPGAGCDVPTRLYSLSFSQRDNWDRFFSLQPEIKDYLHSVADEHFLNNKAYFRSEVTAATYDEENAHWRIDVHDLETDETYSLTARILFSCVGALSVPRDCDVPGNEKFKGKIFHSARWDKTVDLKGKNVVVLGNGASASQLMPIVATEAKQLTQVVRAKHWYLPHFKYPLEGAIPQWMERNIWGFTSLQRAAIVAFAEGSLLQAFNRDGKGARARAAKHSTNYIKTCAPPEYHDLLIPRPGELEVACKRRIFDSSYIPCLARDNVELTNDQAAEFTEDSLILKSGRKVPVDVVILSTGFKTDQYALQMKITNGQGKTLEHYWRKETIVPQAYRTEMIAPFPNMFIIWGPNSVTGHFSAIWSQERAVEMSMRLLRPIFLTGDKNKTVLERSHGKSLRVRQAAEDYEQEYIREEMEDMIYTTGCGSWYVDPKTGRVTALQPSFQTTVAFRSKCPYFPDFSYRGVSQKEAWQSWTLQTRITSMLRLGATPTTKRKHASRSYLLRFILLPFRSIRYIIARILVRMLQFWTLFSEMCFPAPLPQPLPERRRLEKA